MLDRVLAVALCIATAPAALAEPVRVMAVGDSLTAVRYYRERFIAAALADRRTIQMVGPLEDTGFEYGNDPLLNRHAGFSGRQIGAFNDAASAESLPSLVSTHRPDVVLLQVGTNNMNHGLGIGMPEAQHYPNAGASALAAEFAQPRDGSYLDGLGARWGNPAYGNGYLRGELDRLVQGVLRNPGAPRARLVIAKIPPIGEGALSHNPGPDGRDCNDNAVARIEEFNGYIDDLVAALATEERERVRVVDNFAGVTRGYGDAGQGFNFGPAEAQARDWVHPQPDAPAWRTMGDNFYAGFEALLATGRDLERP